tara:strand:+ start:1138 stop:1407 length:270 start_codon:yes stop_codon:yes gene_type:complete
METQSHARPTWKVIADKAITVFIFVLLAYCIVSWIPSLRNGAVGATLETVMGPILAPVRMIIPPVGGLDLSVLVYFFGLQFVQQRFLRN